MTPQRAPTNSFSACWQSKASFVRSIWFRSGSVRSNLVGPILVRSSLVRSSLVRSRALRHVPLHQQVRATQLFTRPRQHGHNANHVIAPVPGALGRQMIEIELDLLGVIFEMNHELPIMALRNRGAVIEAVCRRHDKAIVVIGVFADQIDSSRSLVSAGRTSK